MALTLLGSSKAQETQVIGKSNIKLSSKLMTPEAMWAMGRIGSCQASPDGKPKVPRTRQTHNGWTMRLWPSLLVERYGL